MSETLAAPSFLGRIRWRKLGLITLAVVVTWIVLDLLGWDVLDWFESLWDTMTEISLAYLVAGLAAQTVQTTFTALAWLPILRYAYPQAEIPFKPVLASYAVGVALNGFLPANIGTFVMMFLFMTFIPGSTFPGVFAGWLVHKIFFTVAGGFVYLYLFLSVGEAWNIELGNISGHPLFTVTIILGGAILLLIVGRIFWQRIKKLWEQAKAGGRILAYPRVYLLRVALPELVGWSA